MIVQICYTPPQIIGAGIFSTAVQTGVTPLPQLYATTTTHTFTVTVPIMTSISGKTYVADVAKGLHVIAVGHQHFLIGTKVETFTRTTVGPLPIMPSWWISPP